MLDLLGLPLCRTTVDNFTVMSTAGKYLDLLRLPKLIWEFISNYLLKHVNIEIKTILQ